LFNVVSAESISLGNRKLIEELIDNMNLESSENDELLPIYKDEGLNERLYIDRNLDIDNNLALTGLKKRSYQCKLFFYLFQEIY
jgi:hypothetical protein